MQPDMADLPVDNVAKLIHKYGTSPLFHDAELLSLELCEEVLEDDLYIGRKIKLQMEIVAVPSPYVIAIYFYDCEDIEFSGYWKSPYIWDILGDVELEDKKRIRVRLLKHEDECFLRFSCSSVDIFEAPCEEILGNA